MNTLQRVIAVLSLVVILPTAFYSVYEISSMNKDEEMILQIYQNQLDALLFSGNQYSNDITNGWVKMIESDWLGQENTQIEMSDRILQILQLNPSIISIHITDTSGTQTPTIYSINDQHDHNALNTRFQNLIQNKKPLLERLARYQINGFQKLEPIKHEQDSVNTINLMFILNQTSTPIVCGIELDVLTFIQEALGPKLQTTAEQKFVFSVFRKDNNSIVYSTIDTLTNPSISPKALVRDFWILPDYYLAIDTVGESLDAIVRNRTYTNLALLLILDIILMTGVWLIFRNVKKELHLAQSKSDFVSNVSHEIRTPLALISMFAETLEMGRVKSEEKKHEYYGIITKETARLTGMVNKILSFSQLEANKKNFNFENIELSETIQEVLSTYEFHLKNKGFECSASYNDNLIINADKEAIHEVFVNLIDNAIKYSNGTKKVEVSTGKTTLDAYLRVKDYGVGISKKDQKHIFDKFYRVSSGDLAKSKGTGLGLSLVKQIIDEHNGRLEVESELGKGSTFSVYFPLNN